MRSSLIVFEYLDDNDLAWIELSCRKLKLMPGGNVIDRGVCNEGLYLLLSGKCEVTAADGRSLDTMIAGDLIGEASFVDGRKTAARVAAKTEVVLAVIDPEVLRDKLDADLAFAVRFYKAVASVLAYRLRHNLQVAIGESTEVMGSSQEFAGEIDVVDLDGTARAGFRLASLLAKLL